MASVLSGAALVQGHVPEITDPQESGDNKQRKGLGGAEYTLSSIILNLLNKLHISEKAYYECKKCTLFEMKI